MSSRMGVRARFTLLYGIALSITVLLVSGGIYFFVQRALSGQIENHLRKDMASLTEYLKFDPNGLFKIAAHGPIEIFNIRRETTTIVSSDDWMELKLDSILPAKAQFPAPTSIIAPNGKAYLLQSTTIDAGGPCTITVGHHEGAIRQTLRTLSHIILLTLPVTVAISLAVGYLIAGRVLSPISAITRKAEEISAENLSERLPVSAGDDEFTRLATVFNQTFARIEDSFERLRSFTADASHELRTPLSAIRSIGETALHAPDGQLNCRETIGSILEESDRLRQLVDALLLLSRADSAEIELRRETVDLAGLAHETIDFLGVLAEEKQQAIVFSELARATAQIDRSSIRRALTNLLDNAIKYAPADSTIRVTVGRTRLEESYVEIADSGPGISEQDIQRIFDRFYRVDKGRSRELGGAGLGLSISKWAVEINGGRIEVESGSDRGSLFRVLFPPDN